MDHTFNYLFYILSAFFGGSLIFLVGFFPVSQNLGTIGSNYGNSSPLSLHDKRLSVPNLQHEQVILMLIDAWRSDFANETNMPYSHKKACSHINIKVNIPTVTMPRLKTITTGTISNFIDIILNLGNTEKLSDSLLHRANTKGKRTVFAGDQTWMQLFPDIFLRHYANMDSFFVNDFYEGDKNITANVRKELALKDWQFMILHYLGLDHIGHVEGSHSHKIFEKLREMDNVVNYISSSKLFQNKLLLVTGDHGMRNGGSHGGSDKEELYVPLMLFSDRCQSMKQNYTPEYNQIDITPTLAILLGIDIPFSSIGCLISEFLMDYSREEQLYSYYYNALHLVEKFRNTYTLNEIKTQSLTDYYFWLAEAELEHKRFLESNAASMLSYEKAMQNYMRVSKSISKLLGDTLVKYDNDLIFISLVLTTLAAIHLIINTLLKILSKSTQWPQFVSGRVFLSAIMSVAINCVAHFLNLIYSRHFVYSAILTIPIAISIYLGLDIMDLFLKMFTPVTYSRRSQFNLSILWILFSFLLLHTFSLSSSSFIEEEHQTWYYLAPTLLVFLAIQNFYINVKKVWNAGRDVVSVLVTELWHNRSYVLAMLLVIFCRRLNQTGDKFRHLEDIGDVLAREQNYAYLLGIFITALICLLWTLNNFNTRQELWFCGLALFCVFLYREWGQYNFLVLLTCWMSLAAITFLHYRKIFCIRKNFACDVNDNLVQLWGSNFTVIVIISALLHKPHNVILVPALIYTLDRSYTMCDNLYMKAKRHYNCFYIMFKVFITIFIGNMYYFFQGNSNSLSTIDLNPGYVGLSSYNPLVAGSFITLNTYSAPIISFLYLMWHMFTTRKTCLPTNQQNSNGSFLNSKDDDLYLVISLFAAATVMPVAVYWLLLVGFRHHLFIYSVFAPKAFYECFNILVFYLNFILTNLYFRLFQLNNE
uniref:GPI ethanolamine phosphate transferase 2 C-terminal domain-containing protein n=1 Tax=Stomoxys calcitrans TaxID=35570 RepID=A0A1I8P023_STOCA